MCPIIFMSGLISSLATNSRDQLLSRHLTSSITARMKVVLSLYVIFLQIRLHPVQTVVINTPSVCLSRVPITLI